MCDARFEFGADPKFGRRWDRGLSPGFDSDETHDEPF